MAFRNGYQLPNREKAQSLEDFSRRWSSRWMQQPISDESLEAWLKIVVNELDEFAGGEEFHSVNVFETGHCFYFRINLLSEEPKEKIAFTGSLSVNGKLDNIFGVKKQRRGKNLIARVADFYLENGENLYFAYPKAAMYFLPELAVQFANRVVATVLSDITGKE